MQTTYRVMSYRLVHVHPGGWRIVLVCSGMSNTVEHTLDFADAMSFHAVADILRNERPITFDAATRTLSTGNEPVGEEEID